MLGKTSNLTYCQVRDRYENFRSRCTDDNKIELVIKEDGCVKPLYGKKSKCLIRIVPDTRKVKTLEIDKHEMYDKQKTREHTKHMKNQKENKKINTQ